jgi:hypothetical protein
MRSQPEHTIVEHSLWGLRASVFRGVDAGRDAQTRHVIANAARTVIGPIGWSDELEGPWFIAATGQLDPSLPAFCGQPPPEGVGFGIDTFFSWASFGYAWESDADGELLDKAAAMADSPDALSGLVQFVKQGKANVETTAAALAAFQQL